MKSRVFIHLYFVATGVACVGLAATWWWMRSSLPATASSVGRETESRANMNSATPGGNSAVAAATLASTGEPTGASRFETDDELRRYASQPRRHARAAVVLELVERLKALPRPDADKELPPPPVGRGGFWFPELMNDPEFGTEYRRLMQEVSRYSLTLTGNLAGPRLMSTDAAHATTLLGDPTVNRMMVERQMVLMELSSLPAAARSSASGQALQKKRDEVEVELRARLGDDGYGRLLQGRGYEFESVLGPLESRLSYSSAPLTAEQRSVLNTAFAAVAQAQYPGAEDASFKFITDRNVSVEAKFEQYLQSTGTVLTTEQKDAFRRVLAERAALAQRRNLPDNSALPKVPGT